MKSQELLDSCLLGRIFGVFESYWSDLICAAHLEDDGQSIMNVDENFMGAKSFAPPHNRVRIHEPNQKSCTRSKPVNLVNFSSLQMLVVQQKTTATRRLRKAMEPRCRLKTSNCPLRMNLMTPPSASQWSEQPATWPPRRSSPPCSHSTTKGVCQRLVKLLNQDLLDSDFEFVVKLLDACWRQIKIWIFFCRTDRSPVPQNAFGKAESAMG